MSRFLIIPDIHQDLAFLSGILNQEDLDSFDQVILLGDYFDARSQIFASEQATRLTAQFLLELVQSHPRKVRLCWGNHDILYCRLREYVMREDPEAVREKLGDSDLLDTFRRARWVNEVWPGEMWYRLELAIRYEDLLFSHAGIHPDFWPKNKKPGEALHDLQLEWEAVIGNLFENEDHPLLQPGTARGGQQPVGGPLWLDWEAEFVDEIPFRQIVGHSPGIESRQKGRSWCIDCAQQAYGVLEDGELGVRVINQLP